MSDLLIEGDPTELEAIRVAVERTLGREARMEPVTSTASGELREPILIGLIIALGGKEVVKGLVDILRNRATHEEVMKRLEIEQEANRVGTAARQKMPVDRVEPGRPRSALRLKLLTEEGDREIRIEELTSLP